MGLSHLDAGSVTSPPSTHKRAAEWEIAAKKSHKMERSDGKTIGSPFFKDKNIKIALNFNSFFRDFCSVLNGTAPLLVFYYCQSIGSLDRRMYSSLFSK